MLKCFFFLILRLLNNLTILRNPLLWQCDRYVSFIQNLLYPYPSPLTQNSIRPSQIRMVELIIRQIMI